jgi:hypothetical protein
MIDWAQTRTALAAYDAIGTALDHDPAAGVALLRAQERARRRLSESFARATAEINDRATALTIPNCSADWDFLRRVVAC